jgi:uncharacterized membrane protein
MRETLSSDLSTVVLGILAAIVVLGLVALIWEAYKSAGRGIWVFVTGALSTLALALAIARPIRISSRETSIPPRISVLVDGSLSMNLPDEGKSRKLHRDSAVANLLERANGAEPARIELLEFGGKVLHPFKAGSTAVQTQSLLADALRATADRPDEHPDRIVVVSDGPPDLQDPKVNIPIDVLATTKREPLDASIRDLSLSVRAIAHVPLPLHVRIGCSRGLACDGLTVTVKELVESGAPALLATGLAHVEGEEAALDLAITLDRAGPRLLEVSITTPEGDEVPENNVRYLPISVTRERVRILHVAGRVSTDMRALRRWLKSDASVDVIAFFILRTPMDNPQAPDSELALIPFPVDELFREHLNSFDAIVLQDFDAQPYRLEQHLPAIAAYVRRGGGLIMVGGPNSFVAGGYAGTPLAGVLPIALDSASGATHADTSSFVPAWSEQGLSAPLLRDLRATVGTELPSMPGANILGELRPGAVALWQHPTRTLANGKKMPLLALGDSGSGRSIALALDGTWQLEFSALGARTGGRGYAALWDGLLGWLMRDPRYEPMQLNLDGPCISGREAVLELQGAEGEVDVTVEPMGGGLSVGAKRLGTSERFSVAPLASGAYLARASSKDGPKIARHFACESGGDEWADTRPALAPLRTIAARGSFRFWDQVSALRFPTPKVIQTERHVAPIAPPWLLALVAAFFCGFHWFVRRRLGLR